MAGFWISSVLMADRRNRGPLDPYILRYVSRRSTTYSVPVTFETENAPNTVNDSTLGGLLITLLPGCVANVSIVWFFICRAVVSGRTCCLCFSVGGRPLQCN
jgi:hypothetical protein